MDWQTIAVLIVIAAAGAFLICRLAGIPLRRKRVTQTFVPLASLKKSKPDR